MSSKLLKAYEFDITQDDFLGAMIIGRGAGDQFEVYDRDTNAPLLMKGDNYQFGDP
jgi:hypothetical protein